MKKFAKCILALIITAPFITIAAASTAYYGEPKKITSLASNLKSAAFGGYVSVINYTGDIYTVSGYFKSGMIRTTYAPTLNIYPNDPTRYPPYSYEITYDLSPSDDQACITVVRSDGMPVIQDTCYASGLTVNIGSPSTNKSFSLKAANGLPAVTITKR